MASLCALKIIKYVYFTSVSVRPKLVNSSIMSSFLLLSQGATDLSTISKIEYAPYHVCFVSAPSKSQPGQAMPGLPLFTQNVSWNLTCVGSQCSIQNPVRTIDMFCLSLLAQIQNVLRIFESLFHQNHIVNSTCLESLCFIISN